VLLDVERSAPWRAQPVSLVLAKSRLFYHASFPLVGFCRRTNRSVCRGYVSCCGACRRRTFLSLDWELELKARLRRIRGSLNILILSVGTAAESASH
jgi:hypothetical protein